MDRASLVKRFYNNHNRCGLEGEVYFSGGATGTRQREQFGEAMATTQSEQSESPRILFAEDHQPTRELMAILLSDAGYTVDAAKNGREALQLFQKSPDEYDVLITDHEMPELDGLELVERLREARFGGKIIVVSGGLSFAAAEAYTALEVDQILAKPIMRQILIQAIEESRGCRQEERGALGELRQRPRVH